MNNPHIKALDTAFFQLSFSIKLWHYLREHPINKEHFDISLTINDPGNIICLPDSEFHSYDDIVLASENNISICFGVAVITLWEAFREYKTQNQATGEIEMLADLCYMIRCCFAHGTAVPQWKINDRYRKCYHVGNKTIDLTGLDGQPFDYSHIGGCETLWHIKARLHDLVSSSSF